MIHSIAPSTAPLQSSFVLSEMHFIIFLCMALCPILTRAMVERGAGQVFTDRAVRCLPVGPA
uniref:Uncharacterized protein n=1 Tax=Anguilla anguilla TaxID=7936 RepID=A0A0E9V6J0_ANGAN